MHILKSVDEDINQYWQLLNPLQKKTVLTVVKTFAKEQKDWWDELTESQQHAIDESIAEMKAGKLTAHADVMKKYNSISSENVQGLPRTKEYKDRHNH